MIDLEPQYKYAPDVCANCILRVTQPKGLNPLNLSCDNGSSNSATAFQRVGTTSEAKNVNLPSWLSSLITSNTGNASVPASLTNADTSFLTGLLGRDNTSVPGGSAYDTLINLISNPSAYGGKSALDSMIARNPYSTDYETSTKALYDRIIGERRADAMSGPSNVRGGQARTGFELAEIDTQGALNRFREIRGQQDKEAGVVQQAVQISNTIEQMRRGVGLQAQQGKNQIANTQTQESLAASDNVNKRRTNNAANLSLAAEMFGSPTLTTTTNLAGLGHQATDSHNTSAGVTCCFIFLEVLNGQLPEYVRKGRDEFATGSRRNGYNWMASWLVPLMKRYAVIKNVVNHLLVKPFLVLGKHHYDPDGTFRGACTWLLLRPYAQGWFTLWSTLSIFHKETK
jgi:hypothetical protein